MTAASLEKKAVRAAMSGDWEEAIRLNQAVLKLEPKNVAALNRLARAHWETNNLERARQTYKKVLEIDRYNPIASKNLTRLTDSKKLSENIPRKTPSPEGAFLEEPGKTKTVKLTRLASPKVLSALDSGDQVCLTPKKRAISVTLEDGTYLGSLPEDLSLRLLRFLKGGNRYQTLIKAVDRQHLEIFIREIFRSKKFEQVPSFSPTSLTYIPFLPPEIIHEEKPEIIPTGEEDNAES